jgi:type 1 glutamine amidotransferase
MIASRFRPMFAVWAALILAANFASHAAPIRVGLFKGVGTNRLSHTHTHSAATAIGTLLANPGSAGLGPSLALHPEGFRYSEFGATTAQGSSYATPTTEQRAEFIAALDTLDVVIFLSNTDMGSLFQDAQRSRIEAFSRTKGIVSLHASIDSSGQWTAWDSLNGARFQNHPSSDRVATLRLDTLAASEPAWRYLNAGLADTSFLEEWFSFTTNGPIMRAVPGLKVLLNIDEDSYGGGLGGARAMGADHPMAWYRGFPTGGRFFYTAVGHRLQTYQGGSNPRFLRRQLYNAILWAGRADSGGPAGISDRGEKTGNAFHGRINVMGSKLTVEISESGFHSLQLRTLDGKRLAVRQGHGPMRHDFADLRAGTMYILAIETPAGKATRFITLP